MVRRGAPGSWKVTSNRAASQLFSRHLPPFDAGHLSNRLPSPYYADPVDDDLRLRRLLCGKASPFQHLRETKPPPHRLEGSAFQPVRSRMKGAELAVKAEPFRTAGRQSREDHWRKQLIWTALRGCRPLRVLCCVHPRCPAEDEGQAQTLARGLFIHYKTWARALLTLSTGVASLST